jgi:hypothetical protein
MNWKIEVIHQIVPELGPLMALNPVGIIHGTPRNRMMKLFIIELT